MDAVEQLGLADVCLQETEDLLRWRVANYEKKGNEMKTLVGALLVAIVLSACAPDVRPQLERSQAAYEELSATATAEANRASSDADQAAGTIAELNKRNAELETDLAKVRDAFKAMSALNDGLQVLAREALAVGDCSTTTDAIDYTNNSTISESLKTFIGETGGSVHSAEWDVVWNNAKTAIHKVSSDYLYVFLVYFDNEDLGYTDGVFWIDGACWLDH
jgi:hypothetical protein